MPKISNSGIDLWPTALHEAGHVVMMLSVDVPVKKVVIGANLRRGMIGYVRSYRKETRDIILCLAVAMSGKIAENIVLGTRQTTNGLDRETINDLLRGLSTKKRRRYTRRAAIVGRAVVHANMTALKRLARHLMKHRAVYGTRRIERVLGGLSTTVECNDA